MPGFRVTVKKSAELYCKPWLSVAAGDPKDAELQVWSFQPTPSPVPLPAFGVSPYTMPQAARSTVLGKIW